MYLNFLSHLNYLAVFVTAIILFVEGSLWFSVIFKNLWRQELKKHHVTIKEPTQNDLIKKMLLTFLCNILVAFGVAFLVLMTNSTTVMSGLHLGTVISLAFAVTTLGTVFIWENRSLTLFLIDVGYPVLGIITSAIILSVWL